MSILWPWSFPKKNVANDYHELLKFKASDLAHLLTCANLIKTCICKSSISREVHRPNLEIRFSTKIYHTVNLTFTK